MVVIAVAAKLVYVLNITGVFDPLNQGAKGPAPPLEQKSDDRWKLFITIYYAIQLFNHFKCDVLSNLHVFNE